MVTRLDDPSRLDDHPVANTDTPHRELVGRQAPDGYLDALPPPLPPPQAPLKDRTTWSGERRRLLVIIGRVVLWALVAVLLLRGTLSVLSELRVLAGPSGDRGDTPTATAQPAFPVEAAEAFAAQFAQEYLTFNRDAAGEREARLAPYVPDGRERQFGWDGTGQRTASSAIPVTTRVIEPRQAIVTVAVRMTPPPWIYLEVPVASDDAGGLVVAAPPSFVAPPPGIQPQRTAPPATDVTLSRELRPTIESFFRAYGAGSTAELTYFLPVGRSIQGLGGVFHLDALVDLRVDEGGDRREAVADVRWLDQPTGARLTQSYRLVLRHEGGRWYVDQLGSSTR